MSWIEKLYLTYESNLHAIGDPNDVIPLLPVAHTTQNAHVTIVIGIDGKLRRAEVVPKTDARTIIPATEESAGRTGSKPINHPLCDKLQFVAGDFLDYGGEVTSGYSRDPNEPHREYKDSLKAWCSSPHAHPKVVAVLDYIEKGRLVSDLLDKGVLRLPKQATLATKIPKGPEAPPVIEVLQGQESQSDVFVRFSVEIPGDPSADLWSDPKVWKSWSDYYASTAEDRGFCYVTGEQVALAKQHPKRIRNSGDGAKLISSNDNSGFTYRGRFVTADQACGVGADVTQKAHSALRWLISRQGETGMQTYVAWAVSGADIPDPFADTRAVLAEGPAPLQSESLVALTAQEVGVALSKLISGYSARLGATEDVIVMGLDSATPGRMAITYYRELTGSEFLGRVLAWHRDCSWQQFYGKDLAFVGAPAPRDIAECAYGRRLDEKLRKKTVERLLPCIVDGMPIPRDLVEVCVRRATNRAGIGNWEWEKALGIACALYRHQNREREYQMALERERTTRDYLYGRLLALAEHVEGRALHIAGEERSTNAARFTQRFAQSPYSTWRTIELSLAPYRERLRAKNRHRFLDAMEREMDEITSKFAPDDFLSDQRLSGEFLLGYHCQRTTLFARPKEEGDGNSMGAPTESDEQPTV